MAGIGSQSRFAITPEMLAKVGPSFEGTPIIPVQGADRSALELGQSMGRSEAPIAAALKHQSLFDRMGSNISSFLSSPEGRAELMRSGAATMTGGLGAGVTAATNYADQRRHDAEGARRFDLESALKERGVNIDAFRAATDADLGTGKLALEEGDLEERGRHNRAGEGLEARSQNVQKYGIDTGAQTQRRGQDVQRYGIDTDAATSRRGQDVGDRNSQRDYDASIYGSNMGYMASTARAAGIGSNQPRVSVATTQPARPGVNHFFAADEPPQPKVTTTVSSPMAPAGRFPPPPPEAIQALRDHPGLQAEFEGKYGPGSAMQFLGGR